MRKRPTLLELNEQKKSYECLLLIHFLTELVVVDPGFLDDLIHVRVGTVKNEICSGKQVNSINAND